MVPGSVMTLRPGMRVGTAQGEVEVVRVLLFGRGIIGRYVEPPSETVTRLLGGRQRPSEGTIPFHEIGSIRSFLH